MMMTQDREKETRSDFLEPHYTLSELSKAWHVSRTMLKQWFINEPGVVRYGSDKIKKGRARTHLSLRVPESIARSVYKRRTGRKLPGDDG